MSAVTGKDTVLFVFLLNVNVCVYICKEQGQREINVTQSMFLNLKNKGTIVQM